MTGIEYDVLLEASRKGTLKTKAFGSKEGVLKTPDEEFDEWSRRELYTAKENKLKKFDQKQKLSSTRQQIKATMQELKSAGQ